MELNKIKSYIMFITKNKRRCKKTVLPTGKIEGIDIVEQTKYLGIILDNYL